MLHAIYKNKSKLYKRYWVVRDFHDRGNITAEDEITSTLFGPLDFMTPSDVWNIAKKFLGDKAPAEDPTYFRLEFWEKLERGEGKRDIEPDALLRFYQDDEPNNKPIIAILFELKWNELEGIDKENKYQLDKQWEAFKKLHDCNVFHLFIAKELAVKTVVEALKNEQRKDIWRNRLICLTWDDVCARLGEVEETDSRAVYRWACLANNFLQFATTRPFGGFGMSAEEVPEGFGAYPEIDFLTLNSRPLFWDDHWFARLDKLFPADIPLHQPLFFTGKNYD